MSERADAVARELGRCVHFNGIQHDHCKAGVAYKPLRDVSKPGMARWPCIGNGADLDTCSFRRFPTRAEAEATVAEQDAAISGFLAKLADGKVCPHCDKPIEGREQIGRCVYVKPCGHRLGQAAPGPAARGEEE